MNPAEAPAPDANQPMATVACVYCQTTLSYPQNSLYIQCPKCQNTMNPSAPHASYVNCIGCNTLLSHPPTSLTIQCPKCLMVMDLPSRGAGGMMMGGVGGDGSQGRKSRKKRKDPNAPKRATNAYMVFCKERRAALKEERPDLAFGKLGQKLGDMWRVMSAEEKKPYEMRATTDRDRYKSEMGSYQSANMLKNNSIGMQDDPYQHSKKMKGEDGSAIGLDYPQLDPSQLEMIQAQQFIMQQQAMMMAAQQQQQLAAGVGGQPQQLGAQPGSVPQPTAEQFQEAAAAAAASKPNAKEADDEEDEGEEEE